MRTARIRAAGEAMPPKDSQAGNHAAERIRKTERIAGKGSSNARGLEDADGSKDSRAMEPAESQEKTMNVHAKVSAPAATTDRDANLKPEPARSGPPSLGFDMSALSIAELSAVVDCMRTLSDVASGFADQPRCADYPVGQMIDDLIERMHWDGGRAVDEIAKRVPGNDREKATRDLAIMAAATDRAGSIEEALDWMHDRIGRDLVGEEDADRRWELVERASSPEPRKPAIVATVDRYTMDDLESDLWHLHELISTIDDTFMDMEFLLPDGSRNRDLDRVSSLTSIAKDRAKAAAEAMGKGFDEVPTAFIKKARAV